MFEPIDRRQFVEALMTTVVLEQRDSIGTDCSLLIVEVSVSVNDLATLVTTGRSLPSEVLQLWLDVTLVVREDKFGA